jgi:soluble cytochrome b562
MRLNARVLTVSGVMLALGVCLLSAVGLGIAADDKDEKEKKEMTEAVLKLADAVEKGDKDAIQKLTEEIGKKYPLGTVMELFKPRAKGGLGVDSAPLAGKVDGIEARIQDLSKKPLTQADLAKQTADLEKMVKITAAIAQIADYNTPKKKVGEKDPKDWKTWTMDMQTGAADVTKAIKAKNEKDLKTAAAKLNSSCNNCHGVFRD